MDNRNTIIAVVLMVLVWIAFSIIFPPAPPPPQQQQATVTTATAPVAQSPQAATTVVPATSLPQPVPQGQSSLSAREIKVETDFYHAVFSTQGGGQLQRLELKNYRADNSAAASSVELISGHGDELAAALSFSGDGEFSFPSGAIFHCEEPRSSLTLTGDETATLRFQLTQADGSLITREIKLFGHRYVLEQKLRFDNRGVSTKNGRLMAQLRDQPLPSGLTGAMTGFTSHVASKLHDDSLKNIEKEVKTYKENLHWSGIKSKYFLRALQPSDSTSEIQLRKHQGVFECRLTTPQLSVVPGQQGTLSLQTYFGPLELEALRTAGSTFEEAVDFGFFSLLAKPFFHILKFFYSYVGNYGFAIIILTILIKLAFWPLTQKSYASMKAMQTLQPEMQKLREKFKNDRERMNREIMQLYQQHRVNPLGGCLPMLVQIPFFFALYQVLMVSIDLRHAPFLLWITDLSVKDPYYVTPLIMGATMFIQQKMTPSQMDPIQQKIFLAMPIVFTFLFLSFPSGLVLYWLVNNLLTILQQYLINRTK